MPARGNVAVFPAGRRSAAAFSIACFQRTYLVSLKPLNNSSLQDSKVDIKIKLAALWAATMFCYIYGDYFELYIPGKLSSMLDGKMLPLGTVTQGILLATTIMMAIQAVMVFLSLVVAPLVNKWLNVALGLAATLVMILAIQGAWTFYKLLGLVEIGLLLTIVWQAWTWPRSALPLRHDAAPSQQSL